MGSKTFGILAQDKKGLYLEQTPNVYKHRRIVSRWTGCKFYSFLVFCGFALPFLQQLSLKHLTRVIAFLSSAFAWTCAEATSGGVEGHTNPCFLCYRMKSLLLKRLWHVSHNFFPRIRYSVWTLFFVDFIVCGKKTIFQALVPSHQSPDSTKSFWTHSGKSSYRLLL